MKKSALYTIIGIAAACVAIFIGVFVFSTVKNSSESGITTTEAGIKLDNKLKKVSVSDSTLRKSSGSGKYDTLALADELPDISEYPLTTQGDSELVIEIASSTEKSGTGTDGALNAVAEKFNEQQFTVNGKVVSVSVRSIASGEAIDYISSGKYVPDAYTPSNQLWGQMLEAKGVSLALKEERLAGNVAGFVLEKDKYEEFKEKYGEVNIDTINQAITSGELTFGYTNPYASSTGLNFLLSLLYSLDPSDPLSDTAAEGFAKFQKNVTHVSFTTIQLRNSVEKGTIKSFVYEHQNFVNTTELRDYIFTPFGVRHDNPIYAVGDLSADKEAALDKFIEYCLNEESQKVFTEYGFNQEDVDSYVGDETGMNGNTIISAQKLWKVEKSVRPVAAVFIADTSGSMMGDPLNQLKASLLNASDYIGDEHAIGLVTYDSKVYRDLPIGMFDETQRSYFKGAIEYMSASGGTATNNAILVALKMLKDYQEENPDVKPMIILLSDGNQTDGLGLSEIKDIIAGMQIPIYTIGYNATIENLEEISNINEAATINATSENVIYKLKSFFNAEL